MSDRGKSVNFPAFLFLLQTPLTSSYTLPRVPLWDGASTLPGAFAWYCTCLAWPPTFPLPFLQSPTFYLPGILLGMVKSLNTNLCQILLLGNTMEDIFKHENEQNIATHNTNESHNNDIGQNKPNTKDTYWMVYLHKV